MSNKWMPPRHPWMSVPESPQNQPHTMPHGQTANQVAANNQPPPPSSQQGVQVNQPDTNQSEHPPLSLHWSDPLMSTKTWSTVTGEHEKS